MIDMKKLNWLALVMAAAAMTACDPYPGVAGGAARIVDAGVTNHATWHQGTATGTPPTVAWSAVACTTPTGALEAPFITVVFNRQLDGAGIQTGVDDCTPANGWLTVTPPAPAGSTWYSCYSPSAPDKTLGGSVVIYLGPAAVAATATTAAVPPSSSWSDAEDLAQPPPYHLTGVVEGESLDVTVSAGEACPVTP
jgi:hypothetical protein